MQQSRSVSKNGRNRSLTPHKSHSSKRVPGENEFYYCHFKNAVYMGGIKAFQKHGRGIVIHDNGTCAVTNYSNDFKNGHNVYYSQHCAVSVEYRKNKIEDLAIRKAGYLLYLRIGKDQKPEGRCLLLDYRQRKIYYVGYRRGVIVEKREEQDQAVLNRVFDLSNIEYLMGDHHGSAIKFEILPDHKIGSQRISSRFQVGFYKKGVLNGLGFNLLVKDPQQSGNPHHIFVQLLDRGYYLNSALNGMGEQRFKNGNSYWGGFKAGAFQGLGLLRNQLKKNWVYGDFQIGNLSELMEYSHDGDEGKLRKLIATLHERNSNWINRELEIQDFSVYLDEIQNIEETTAFEQISSLKQKKQEVLKKIQENFMDLNQNMDEFRSNQQNNPKTGNIKPQNQVLNLSSAKLKEMEGQKTSAVNSSGTTRFKTQLTQPITITTKLESDSIKSSSRAYLQVPAADSSSRKGFKAQKSAAKKTQNQEELSFALDERRLVGKSRVFKQYQPADEEDLPRFTYAENK